MNCVNCNSTIDKKAPLSKCQICKLEIDNYYIQDYSLILLDLILCKVEVYRHILHNSSAQIIHYIILFILYILLELFYKYQTNILEQDAIRIPWMDVLDYSKQILITILSQIIILFICAKIAFRHISSIKLLQGLVLAQYGRLAIILFVIWGHSPFFKTMATLSILLSELSILRSLGEQNRYWIKSMLILIVSILIRKYLSSNITIL